MNTEPLTEKDLARRARFKRWRRYAFVAGVVLGLVCKMLPADYQAPCAALAKICTTGGF